MDQIIHDRSDAAAIEAVYNNLYGFYDFIGKSSKAYYHTDSNLTWLITKLPIPFMNPVFRAKLFPEKVDEKIKEMTDLFAANGVNHYSWFIDPENISEYLAARLLATGFAPAEFFPGMCANINEVPGSMKTMDEITVQRVKTAEQFMEWNDVLVKGFGLPDPNAKMSFDLLIEQGFDSSARYYTALWHEISAACSMLLLAGGVAGIYSVATLAEARGKGLGAAVTMAALNDAREMGYEISVLQSSKMGYPVYQKLGFRKVCDLEEYHIEND